MGAFPWSTMTNTVRTQNGSGNTLEIQANWKRFNEMIKLNKNKQKMSHFLVFSKERSRWKRQTFFQVNATSFVWEEFCPEVLRQTIKTLELPSWNVPLKTSLTVYSQPKALTFPMHLGPLSTFNEAPLSAGHLMKSAGWLHELSIRYFCRPISQSRGQKIPHLSERTIEL